MTPPMFDSTAARFEALTQQAEALNNDLQSFGQTLDLPADSGLTWIQVFDGYAAVLVVAFLVSLIATPIMRRLAMANGVVDRPDARKIHRMPIAYLGGVAVFLGIMGGVLVSFFGATGEDIVRFHDTSVSGMRAIFPPTILLGITVIMLIGLIDDVVGISPRLKVGGQLFAAAALAADSVGTSLAKGVLSPTLGAWLNHSDLTWHIPLPTEMPFLGSTLELDLIYWTGTAVIAIFVLGGCNASNLIDGLDGLCSGVTAVAMIGMLAIAIMMVDDPIRQDSLEGPRIVLILAVLGACLGFLPHNFNPANIFLGDCGSLMLGFTSIVVILTLGETGRTELVVAGLFIYGVPDRGHGARDHPPQDGRQTDERPGQRPPAPHAQARTGRQKDRPRPLRDGRRVRGSRRDDRGDQRADHLHDRDPVRVAHRRVRDQGRPAEAHRRTDAAQR